jgi:hypothetical protein
MPDRIHLCLSIPPKYSVADTIGFLKGKSAVRIHRELLKERRMTGLRFWSSGYCVSTVGLDEARVRQYIREQDELDRRQGELNLDLHQRSQWGLAVCTPPTGATSRREPSGAFRNTAPNGGYRTLTAPSGGPTSYLGLWPWLVILDDPPTLTTEMVSPFSRRRVVASGRQGAGSRQSEPDKTNSKMIEIIKPTGTAIGAAALLMEIETASRARTRQRVIRPHWFDARSRFGRGGRGRDQRIGRVGVGVVQEPHSELDVDADEHQTFQPV